MRERSDTIVERWGEALLSSYSSDAAAVFRKQKDPFANPVGESVRRGTRGLLHTILNGMDTEALRSHLDEIIRVRAVQEFLPSQALSFVFALRSIVLDVIPEVEADPRLRREVAGLDATIDRVALAAFDVYAERREEVSRLRVNEVKQQVAWVLEKMNQRDAKAGEAEEAPGSTPSAQENV